MPAWEHRFEEISAITIPADQRYQATTVRIQQLGHEGWELVQVFAERGMLWGAFKRPAVDKPAPVKAVAPAPRPHNIPQ